MKLIISMLIAFSIAACTTVPTVATVQSDLQKVQVDLATIAVNAQPAIQAATTVAGIAEIAIGSPELVPLTNAVSAAVQAANVAVARTAPSQ